MELKTGYKHTEVGIASEAWRDELLGDYVRITSGESPTLFLFTTSGFPYFKVEQLSNSEKYLDSFSTPYHYERGKTVPCGSVVFAKRGAAIALNKVRILAQESFMDTNLMALTPTEELDGEFLFYALGYIGLWRFADTTSVPQINNKHVKPLAFPLPKVAEQRAIAEVLSEVDLLLGALDRLIGKKRDLKQAAVQQLLTGQTRLPGFHDEWDVRRLGNVFSISAGTSKSAYVASGGRYWIVDMGSVSTDGRLIVSKGTNYQGDFLKTGDLVMPKDDIGGGNIIGKVGYIDADDTYVLGDHVYCLRAKEGHPLFLAYLINNYQTNTVLRKKVIGSAQLGLARKSVEEQEIPFPLPSEQSAIAEMLSDMDADIAALGQRRDKTRALKQGMMQELLTGRTRLV